MTSSATSLAANRAAVLASGLRTRLASGLNSSSDIKDLSPDPFKYPAPTDLGFALATAAADVRISFHYDLRARSVWLWIDRDNAPLTGNYVLEVDTTVSTYDATSGAPADVDALLTAWVAQIEADLGSAGTGDVTATLDIIDTTQASFDSIRITALYDDTSSTDVNAYATYALGASTAAPEAADLHILREPDDASAEVYTRTGAERGPSSVLNGAMAKVYGAWARTANLGALDEVGYDQRGNFAERSAAFIRLHTPVTTDETLSIAGSGAGIYGVGWVAVAAVMGQVEP